ncbi:PGF-CTERM sorting domain-containing protein, partial [Halobacterium hubeiense]
TTESPTTESPTTESSTTESPTTTSGGDGDISSPDPNPAGAVSETEPSVSSVPNEAGATAAHTVGTLVGNEIGDSSWNGLEINYSGTGTDVSNVGQGDVVKIGVDRGNNDSNATIDRSLAASLGEVSGSNDGETLTLGLDGDYELQEGDQIIVVYEDVQNPDAGDYSVGIDVNPQSGGEEVSADLHIDAANTATATATETAESTSTATAEPTETATAEPPATTEESTPSASPGFGTVAAVVALAAAAALLVRR